MKIKKLVALGFVIAGLSACASVDTATRNAPLTAPTLASEAATVAPRDYTVQAIRFAVPADLSVSEANSYYPIADIVWRGDPLGDRKQQIAEIFDTAIRAGSADLDGSTPVIVDVTLRRFHSLTERTRYSVGGVHSIKFELTIRDAATGEILEAPRLVNADLPGLGGMAAVAAEQRGEGQKVRILAHLTSLFRDELTGLPGGAVAEEAPGTDA